MYIYINTHIYIFIYVYMNGLFEDPEPEKKGRKVSTENGESGTRLTWGGQQQPEHVIGHVENIKF